jgi:hypothetical protein
VFDSDEKRHKNWTAEATSKITMAALRIFCRTSLRRPLPPRCFTFSLPNKTFNYLNVIEKSTRYKSSLVTESKPQYPLGESSANTFDLTWNEDFERFKEHLKNLKEKEPDNPHCIHTPPEDPHLKLWLTEQRKFFSNQQQEDRPDLTLTEKKRLFKLQSLGIPLDYYNRKWDKLFLQLKEFYQQRGCFPSSSTINHNSKAERQLLVWCTRQRTARTYLHEPGTLPGKWPASIWQDRLDSLEAIGFEWNYDDGVVWREKYERLANYYKTNGHTMFPDTRNRLYIWVRVQRESYNKGIQGKIPTGSSQLTIERIRLLNELDFVWDPRELPWRTRYQDLVKYVKERGPGAPLKKGPLREWMRSQRVEYFTWKEGRKPSTMTNERLRLLQNVGYFLDDSNVKFFGARIAPVSET